MKKHTPRVPLFAVSNLAPFLFPSLPFPFSFSFRFRYSATKKQPISNQIDGNTNVIIISNARHRECDDQMRCNRSKRATESVKRQ